MKILQKISLLSTILFLSTGVNADTDPKQKYIPEEVIVFVTLKVITNKSKDVIAAFTKMYSEFVDKTEPDSLGWSYYQSGDKITLIERYKNEDANIVTAKNISPNGIRHKLMKDQMKIFSVEKTVSYTHLTLPTKA